jgi:predicted MFS family arabinose efflux permease
VLAVFFVNGFAIASWLAHVPFVKEKFQIDSGTLGLVLFAAAVGAVTGLTLAGRLVGRFGSRRVTSVATVGVCAILPLLLLVPTLSLLAATLACFGMCFGAMDVAMNAQAVAVEARQGRPLMSSFHALFSLGGLAGAGVGSALLSLGVDPRVHIVGAALALFVVSALALPALLPSSVDRAGDEPGLAAPEGPLVGLGILALFALLSEGAIGDWSAVYLRVGLGTDPGFAAAGFAAFSLTMTLGRLVGDRLRQQMRAVPLLRLSGAVCAAGLGIALLVGHPIAALVGFGCVGFGLANVVPILFSAAGNTPGVRPSVGVAAIATAGYCGFLIGPPLIGFVAQTTSLPIGLGVIACCTGLIGLLAGYVDRSGALG